jgi:hypothetical protein
MPTNVLALAFGVLIECLVVFGHGGLHSRHDRSTISVLSHALFSLTGRERMRVPVAA